LYGCETWSLTIKDEYRVRKAGYRELRIIFGSKMDVTMGSLRKLHNDELHNLHYSPDIIRLIKSRRIKLAGHVTRIGGKRGSSRFKVGKPEGKSH
jgi:hypothetical protein